MRTSTEGINPPWYLRVIESATNVSRSGCKLLLPEMFVLVYLAALTDFMTPEEHIRYLAALARGFRSPRKLLRSETVPQGVSHLGPVIVPGRLEPTQGKERYSEGAWRSSKRGGEPEDFWAWWGTVGSKQRSPTSALTRY